MASVALKTSQKLKEILQGWDIPAVSLIVNRGHLLADRKLRKSVAVLIRVLSFILHAMQPEYISKYS
jgi:hypothetical protein